MGTTSRFSFRACIFILTLTLAFGCQIKKPDTEQGATWTASEKTELDQLLAAANGLTGSAENIAKSDSILLVAAPLLKKFGRSKVAYQAHTRQVLNLVSAQKIEQAKVLLDSLVLQHGQMDDSLSGFYNGLSGWFFLSQNDYRGAATPLERAATLFEKHGPTAKLNGIYNNLGACFGQLGDHEKAIQYYEAALRINMAKADSIEISKNHKNLAFACLNLGDLESASMHNRLGQGFQPIGNGTFEMQAAEISLARGQPQAALKTVKDLKQKHPALFDTEENEAAAINLLSYGEILLSAGRADEALPVLKQSLAARPAQPTFADWERTKTCFLIGNALLQKKEPTAALDYFQLAIESAVSTFRPNNVLENPSIDSMPPELWLMESLFGKTAALDQLSQKSKKKGLRTLAGEQVTAALDAAESAIEIIQKLKNSFAEDNSRLWLGEYTYRNFYEKPLTLAFRRYQLTGDKSALEKAFFFASKSKAGVLLTALAEKKQLIDVGVSADSIRVLRDLRLTAASIQNHLKFTPIDSLRKAHFKVLREIEQCRKHLKLPGLALPKAGNSSVPQIQLWLPDSTVLVEFFLGEQTMYIFSVSKHKFEVEQKPVTTHLNGLVDGFRRSVSDWNWVSDSATIAEKTYLETSTQLYDLLLKNALESHPKATRLFIVPDQNLARLPFAALLTRPYAGGWKDVDLPVLIKQMAVSYRFSSALEPDIAASNDYVPHYGFGGFGTDYREGMTLSALHNASDPLSKNVLLALRGGPDTLDFADDEVDSIAKITGGQKWLNAQATKSNFLNNVANCRVLHISLHTIETDPHDPTSLAIVFSKMTETDASLLTSSELYSLDLNAELAVVSSCQSGFGQYKQGEGTLSLGRAMALAGCRSTIVNLWKADDRASRDLMISFYKNLKWGLPKDLALQQASLNYLNSTISDRAGPHFWANFSAVGEMAPLTDFEGPQQQSNYWANTLFAVCLVALVLALLWRARLHGKKRTNLYE